MGQSRNMYTHKKQDENFDINKRDSTAQTFEQDRTQQRPLFHPQKTVDSTFNNDIRVLFCLFCRKKEFIGKKKKRNNVDTKLIKLDTHERDNRKRGEGGKYHKIVNRITNLKC